MLVEKYVVVELFPAELPDQAHGISMNSLLYTSEEPARFFGKG